MPGELSEGHMCQLGPRGYTAQHQASAAHITSSDELFGKHQAVSEDAEHGFQVFQRCDASEKDKVAVFACDCFQGAAIPFQWQPVT